VRLGGDRPLEVHPAHGDVTRRVGRRLCRHGVQTHQSRRATAGRLGSASNSARHRPHWRVGTSSGAGGGELAGLSNISNSSGRNSEEASSRCEDGVCPSGQTGRLHQVAVTESVAGCHPRRAARPGGGQGEVVCLVRIISAPGTPLPDRSGVRSRRAAGRQPSGPSRHRPRPGAGGRATVNGGRSRWGTLVPALLPAGDPP
jgi:hypothetical protein